MGRNKGSKPKPGSKRPGRRTEREQRIERQQQSRQAAAFLSMFTSEQNKRQRVEVEGNEESNAEGQGTHARNVAASESSPASSGDSAPIHPTTPEPRPSTNKGKGRAREASPQGGTASTGAAATGTPQHPTQQVAGGVPTQADLTTAAPIHPTTPEPRPSTSKGKGRARGASPQGGTASTGAAATGTPQHPTQQVARGVPTQADLTAAAPIHLTTPEPRPSTNKGKGRAREVSPQGGTASTGAAATGTSQHPTQQVAGGVATQVDLTAAAGAAAAAAARAGAAIPASGGRQGGRRRQEGGVGGHGRVTGGSSGSGRSDSGAIGGSGAEGGGGEGPPGADEENDADDSERLSPAQLAFFEEVKSKIDTNIVHHAGGVKAQKGGSGRFPYDGPLITPKCASMQGGRGLPKVDPFFLKCFYAWIPEYLWPELAITGIPCPRCGTKGSPDGWNPKGPRRVFMEHDVAYIIGFRYKCSNCEAYNGTVEEGKRRAKTFNAWDSGCLARLPSYVSKEFRFLLTHRSGIDVHLVDRLADGLVNGMNFSAAARHIRQAYITRFMTEQVKYASMTEERRSKLVRLLGGASIPERFGDFDDPRKYCGAVPSDRYLRFVWRLFHSEVPVLKVDGEPWTREHYQHRVMQRWDGQILSGDASYKFAKIIRLGTTTGGERTRPVHGIFTVFNEYEQVVFQRPMKTNALSELMPDLKLLFFGRYTRNGFKLPVLWGTDDCCADRVMLQRMSRELEEETGVSFYLGDELSTGVELESLPMLKLEGVCSIAFAPQTIADACGLLRLDISSSKVEGKKVAGVDAEWEIDAAGRGKVATIQIAPLRGTSFLFHLRRGDLVCAKETFPAPLKALLEDSSIIKAGVAINNDATHIFNDYGVVVKNTVDLRTLARASLVETSSRTLAGMTACLLGKQLPKDNVRFSPWASASLSDEQRDYAIRDAWASVLLYEKIVANKDPITSPPTEPLDLDAGSKMRLYNASHSACVAVGNVVSKETAIAALHHWGSSAKLEGPSGVRLRVVVKITDAKVPNAFVQHAKSPPPPRVSGGGEGKTRCTVGEAASKTALRACGAATKIVTLPVMEQLEAGRDEAAVQSLREEGAREGGGGNLIDGEPRESPEDFQGLVLWDIDHMRADRSYTPPLHDVVMDGDGDHYLDTFSYETLPKMKVIQGGGDDDAGDNAVREDGEDEQYLGLDSSDDEAGPQTCLHHSTNQGSAPTHASAPIPEAAVSSGETVAGTGASPPSGLGGAPDPPSASGSSAGAPSLPVRLDPFHGMVRITSRVPKGHPARRVFLALLRDCFFMVNKSDVEAVERVLLNEGKSHAEISNMMEKNWGFFLKNARRRVPCPEVLLTRFDAVITACKDIRDAKTGQVLLSPAALQAVALIRQHISLGCFSDPPGIALYFERGKTPTGLTRYRCVRGTNSTEGYHRYLRTLFSNFCASPSVAHSVLMEFNFRWNNRRAVENRGMEADIGGFSQQYLIDHIQRLTASWYPGQPLYSGWLAPRDFKDNGERAGLADSVLTFDGKPTGAAGEGCLSPDLRDDSTDNNDTSRIDERLSPSLLLPSARHLASLNNYSLPVAPVSTPAEKQKFMREFFKYHRADSGPSSRNHQRVDFSGWTSDWNGSCGRIESGQEKFTPIFRKTAGLLQQYATKLKDRLNFTNTMAPVLEPVRQLSTSLRQRAPAEEFVGSVGSSRMPDPVRAFSNLLGSSATVAGAALAAVRAGAGAAAATAAATAASAEVGGAGGGAGGVVDAGVGTPVGAGQKGDVGGGSRAVRKYRGCRVCGHHKVAWSENHPGPRSGQPKCSVPENQRRQKSESTYDSIHKKKVFPRCECIRCRGSYDE